MAKDYDVKIVLAGQTEKYRLAQVESRKLWAVSSPATELEVKYELNDASLGVGLLRAQQGSAGTQLRIADGYGVDLTAEGLVKHGPGAESVGSYAGTALKVDAFLSNTYLLTTTYLYNYAGSSLVTQGAVTGAKNSACVFNNELYIAAGADGGQGRMWKSAAWGAGVVEINDTSTTNINLVAALTVDNAERFYVADGNTVYYTATPNGDNFAQAVKVPETINQMWVMAGYLFVQTNSSMFIIHNDSDGNPAAVEINSKMRLRSNALAGTIMDTEGQSAWSSDGKSVWLLRVLGFNEFDIVDAGPFTSSPGVPFASDIRGDILDISIDIDAVYVTVKRGSDTYCYKGTEPVRGTFTWSPLIKWSSQILDVAGVSAYDGESYLYSAWSGTLNRFKLHDWTVFNTNWQIDTMFLNNGEPTVQKIYHRLSTRVDRTGGNYQPYARVSESAAWTTLHGAQSVDLGIGMVNLTGREVQVRIEVSGNSTSQYLNMRGLQIEGVRRPEVRRQYDFTVYADNKGEADFLRSLSANSGTIPNITRDDLDTAIEVQVYPGWPREVELFDDALRKPSRAFEVRALEIL
tara:strand:+ start:16646 stop:18373 length:1728 start_codon:yes stop_codon:yes gene_type:complete